MLVGMGAAAIGLGAGSYKLLDYFGERENPIIEGEIIRLPDPKRSSGISVEEVLDRRRSRRSYANEPVLLRDISQLCWAAQGTTGSGISLRSAPSAGATYPLEVYLVVGSSDLAAGIYHYSSQEHMLQRVRSGDYRKQLREASLGQEPIEEGALTFVITAVYDRTTAKYGERGKERYVPMEAGHVAENIYLQAESLGLGTVSIGSFNDSSIRELMGAPSEHVPLYVMPVGHVQ